MLSTDMIRVTTRLAEGMGTAWIPNFNQKERFCCRFAAGAARSDNAYSLGLHLAGAELSQGRFASTGIAWDDNRSLIFRRVNTPLGFPGMVFATYEQKALPRDVSGV
jgi:hypothetical protein